MAMIDFSDEDARLLWEMLEKYKRQQNPLPSTGETPLPQSPDVYLARPIDTDGIPPITVDAGGTDPDEAGVGMCDVQQIVYASGDPVIHNRALTIAVYNYRPHIIPYEWFVAIRDKSGRWIPLTRDEVVAFTLTENMGATDAGEASCTIQDVWSQASESYSGTTAGIVKDTVGIFTDATSTSKGIGHWRRGDDRLVIEPYNIECP